MSGLLDTLIQLLYLILQLLHLQASSKKARQILILECCRSRKIQSGEIAIASDGFLHLKQLLRSDPAKFVSKLCSPLLGI